MIPGPGPGVAGAGCDPTADPVSPRSSDIGVGEGF